MNIYLTNAFSLNMLDSDVVNPTFRKVSKEEARNLLHFVDDGCIDSGVIQAIGHADTAAVVSSELGLGGIGARRATVKVQAGDWLVVAQYSGPRLEEGTTTLPDGATIEWWIVTIK